MADMNQSGAVTISDVWLWFTWLFFLPGDYFLHFIINALPPIAQFLEITPNLYGGVISGMLSIFLWLVLFAWIDQPVEELYAKVKQRFKAA